MEKKLICPSPNTTDKPGMRKMISKSHLGRVPRSEGAGAGEAKETGMDTLLSIPVVVYPRSMTEAIYFSPSIEPSCTAGSIHLCILQPTTSTLRTDRQQSISAM